MEKTRKIKHYIIIMCVWRPVANRLYQGGRQSHAKIACDYSGQSHSNCTPSGCQSHANCTRVAASRRQIPIGFFCMRLAATWVQFACIWRPLGYIFYATGGHLVTIWMRLAASRMLFLHATSGQLGAKPPVFWKHAARRIIWIKKSRNH